MQPTCEAKIQRFSGFYLRLSTVDSARLERYMERHDLTRGLAARHLLSAALAYEENK
jgi:hypothetical protein